jgi:hypothetical protein
MVAATAVSLSKDFFTALDDILFHVCEGLQITPARHDLAVARYETLNKVLDGSASPFRFFRPLIYPQGSMSLGTTVAPIFGGPHDLDFVLQLSRNHVYVDPMALIRTLYDFLREHGTYSSMTTLKKRCVRIEYADQFYMDVLPACLNGSDGGTCIKVPDCALKGWSDSNPKGYIDWFKKKSRMILVSRMLDKAEPIPAQQAVGEKDTLQLIVQLLKRWRDIFYAADAKLAPVSVVLTTLAAETYRGERSVSQALTSMLVGVVSLIDESRRKGEKHLHLHNPSNVAEDLTERWDSNPAAYGAFGRGIREFHSRWSHLIARQGNVKEELVALFGEPVVAVLKKRAEQRHGERIDGKLGVSSSGLITSLAGAAATLRPHTFYGEE